VSLAVDIRSTLFPGNKSKVDANQNMCSISESQPKYEK